MTFCTFCTARARDPHKYIFTTKDLISLGKFHLPIASWFIATRALLNQGLGQHKFCFVGLGKTPLIGLYFTRVMKCSRFLQLREYRGTNTPPTSAAYWAQPRMHEKQIYGPTLHFVHFEPAERGGEGCIFVRYTKSYINNDSTLNPIHSKSFDPTGLDGTKAL